MYAGLNEFAARFIGEGPFFAGPDISLADVALIPWVGRLRISEEHRGFSLANTDPKFQGKPGSGRCDLTFIGRAIAWKNHVCELPSFKKTTSEWPYYEPLYMRYLRNEAQSEAAKATREGRAIP